MDMTQQRKLDFLLVLFISCLILANLLGAKITTIPLPEVMASGLNWLFFPVLWTLNTFLKLFSIRPISLAFFNELHVSVSIIVFPITFLVTDMVSEVKGQKEATRFVMMGMLALGMVMLVTAISVALPAASRSIDNRAYELIFGSGFRITFASLLAFTLSQTHDVWMFHLWKRVTKGRHLWLRNNVSTAVSQLIDSTVFMFVAFYHLTPKFTTTFIVSLMIPYWIFKVCFAILDTPLCYVGVKWLSKRDPI